MSLRVPVLVFAGMFVATLVLIGCDAADHSPAPADEDPAAGHLNLTWNDLASDEGTALVLLGEGNRQIFHMACLRADREMQIIASDFTVIGSEERMTMGIANEAFGFVADTQWTGSGVMARTAIDPSLLDHLARTSDLSVLYGIQQGGPWPAPSQDQRDGFILACAEIGQLDHTDPTE
ncbi:hypothetical protein [Brevundimonas aveniformis]|uniref:hypothetical protein n=1 Tax=Brevundimonas aveniformis TaxID=370977 RepID=UPI00048E7998|nr:hypothetical protein [Brevundimonas aveniformis]